MNYQKIYNQLIERAKQEEQSCIRVKHKRNHPDWKYYERHHIIPKCLGGSNDKDNLVLLTAREHFICHHLLIKIHPKNHKLAHAFWLMCNRKSVRHEHFTLSAKQYESARIHRQQLGLSDETKSKISKTSTNRKHSIETRLKISNAAKGHTRNLGRIQSEECKRKISESAKLRVIPDYVRNKISNTLSGRPLPEAHRLALYGPRKRIICPHCGLEGGGPNMSRYHFNNCKTESLNTKY
jgi:hypothetical protein